VGRAEPCVHAQSPARHQPSDEITGQDCSTFGLFLNTIGSDQKPPLGGQLIVLRYSRLSSKLPVVILVVAMAYSVSCVLVEGLRLDTTHS
jgi:hypothetical protein